MKVISVDSCIYPGKAICATIGFFDGVHIGHRFLINQLKNLANAEKSASAVITFPEHPRITLQNGFLPKLLNTQEEKLNQLNCTGIDFCFLLRFSNEIAAMSAEEFIRDILVKQLNVKSLLIGYNHRFGRNRAEGFSDYKKYGEMYGMEVVLAEELPKEAQSVSSTLIRKKLEESDLKEANRLLSYNYQLSGKVVSGNKLGRKIGFPTANLDLSDKNKVIPGVGIYAVWVYFSGEKYPGMAYIGTRPTVTSHGEKRIEVHLIGYSGDLYNEVLTLEFVEYLREDKRFETLEALREQLVRDRENTIKLIGADFRSL